MKLSVKFVQPFTITLVETAWTFCMYFNVASNFNYDFLKLSQKFSCENYLLYSTFIKLLGSFSIEVLQVSLRSSFNFESKYIDLSLTAILMQNNFSQVINCK